MGREDESGANVPGFNPPQTVARLVEIDRFVVHLQYLEPVS